MKEELLEVTEREALFLRGGCRPFVYRPKGESTWRLGWALPGVDVQAFLRQRLEPSLGPLEVELRPEKRPSGVSAAAWGCELEQRSGTPELGQPFSWGVPCPLAWQLRQRPHPLVKFCRRRQSLRIIARGQQPASASARKSADLCAPRRRDAPPHRIDIIHIFSTFRACPRMAPRKLVAAAKNFGPDFAGHALDKP
jgi:hypothetical protein